MRLHIFDVDFTIVRCSTVREFIFQGLKEGLIGPSIGLYAPYLFLRYDLKGFSAADPRQSYPFLRGVAKAELEALAKKLFAGRFLPRIDPAVARRIAEARREGGRAIIASSSFGTILEPLAAHLGVDAVVASELEFKDGVATGRVDGEPAFGEGKRTRVLAYLDSVAVAPADCVFYTDSHRDLPLLREVGRAVAVNPGPRLLRIARDSGWEIISSGSRRKESQDA